jgi:tRNA(Ile)-lysidine synthase
MSRTTTKGAPDRFEERVLSFVRSKGLVEPGGRVLLAVSGGPDSMALFHAMAALAPRLGAAMAVAHLDHGLRGGDGAADAEFVRDAAERLGLPARVERRPVTRRPGESLEMAARRVRYAFLAEAAASLGCTRIATGHTADDQAETVLLRVFRGAGPRGLSGIPAARAVGPGAARVVRPLLRETRAAVLAYLAGRGLPYRVDASNAEPWSVRNRVRAEILPRVAARVNPSIVRTLGRHAEREEAIARYLEGEAGRLCDDRLVEEGPGRAWLPAATLASADPALQPIVVRLAVARAAHGAGTAGGSFPLEEAHLMACIALATAPAGRRVRPLPGGWVVRRVGDRIEFLAPRVAGAAGAGSAAADGFRLPLDVPGRVHIPAADSAADRAGEPPGDSPVTGPSASSAALSALLLPARARGARPARTAIGGPGAFAVEFDWRALRPPLEVRSRRPGDRVAPRGMAGRKTIQDLMVDRKVPWTARDRVPIVADGDRILWVVGLAVSREAPVTDGTRETLLLTFEPSDSDRGDR